MGDNSFKVKKSINLEPSTVPSNPVNGDIYYDSGANEFKMYANSTWQTITSASALNALSDVDVSGALNNDVLKFNGTDWVDGKVTNDNVAAGANIAYSKLSVASSDITGTLAAGSISDSKLAQITTSSKVALSAITPVTTSRVIQSNSSTGLFEASSVTNTELSYLSGVTSAVLGKNQSGTFTNKTLDDSILSGLTVINGNVQYTNTNSPTAPTSGSVKTYSQNDNELYKRSSISESMIYSGSSVVYAHSTSTDIDGGADVTIVYSVDSSLGFDSTSGYDTTTGIFTVPNSDEAGYYWVSARYAMSVSSGNATNRLFILQIETDDSGAFGAYLKSYTEVVNPVLTQLEVSGIVHLGVGKKLRVRASNNPNLVTSSRNTQNECNLSLIKIRG